MPFTFNRKNGNPLDNILINNNVISGNITTSISDHLPFTCDSLPFTFYIEVPISQQYNLGFETLLYPQSRYCFIPSIPNIPRYQRNDQSKE